MKKEEVSQLRAAIAAAKRKLTRLRAGDFPAPVHIALGRIDECLATLVAEGDELIHLAAHRATRAEIDEITGAYRLEQLLTSICAAEVRKRMHAEVTAICAAHSESVDPGEAPALIAKLDRELFELEQRDYDLSESLGIAQRADINPRCSLGLGYGTD